MPLMKRANTDCTEDLRARPNSDTLCHGGCLRVLKGRKHHLDELCGPAAVNRGKLQSELVWRVSK